MLKHSEKLKKSYFFAILGLQMNFLKKIVFFFSIFRFENYLPSCKELQKTNERFMRKLQSCKETGGCIVMVISLNSPFTGVE